MKYKNTLITASCFLSLGGFAFAEGTDTCKDGACDTTAKTECTKGECDSEGVNFVVTGMTCDGCSKKVSTELAKIEGVEVKGVCFKSGHAVVKYDAEKVKREDVVAAIEKAGFKVAGEQLTVSVSGMTCSGCESKVTKSLTALKGCTVGTVDHKTGKVVVTVDDNNADRTKVEQAITSAGFKVTTK